MMLPLLNRQMVLESIVRNPDGAGGYIEDWIPLGQLWVEMKIRYGRMDDGGVSLAKFVFTTRSSPVGAPSRPKPGQRFRAEGQSFLIEAVAEDKDHVGYVRCYATQEVVS